MLIKILKITKDNTDINLREYTIPNFNLINISFHAEELVYKVDFKKYGNAGSKNDNISNEVTATNMIIYFTLYRDTLNMLKIKSSCNGTFIFEYKKHNSNIRNDINIQCEKMIKKSKYNHYSQYFKISNELHIIITEAIFKNYIYHKHDKNFMELCLKQTNQIETNKLYISRKYDVLFGLTINSISKTKCCIYANGKIIFVLDICEGSHYYPLFLIICALHYCNLNIKIDDDYADNIIEHGTILDSDTKSLIEKKRIITCNENGNIYDYKTGYPTLIYFFNKK